MTFDVEVARFEFRALDSVYFPQGKPGNILRGAFGTIFRKLTCAPDCPGAKDCERRAECAYARIFEPASTGAGPSGLSDWPRPFVFRARHLDGLTIVPGQDFHFDLHLFDTRRPATEHFTAAFRELAREGLGPRRGRAELTGVRSRRVEVPLVALETPVTAVTVQFLSPTELKPTPRPEFPVLFARIRDRIANLSALYGAGPLEVDFKGMGERAARVRMVRCEIGHVEVERRSSRTGQVHPIGGFTGVAAYEGDLAGFVPFLEAAQWTGVGRQTVWGNGEVEVRW
jgi:hypothetical protein